MTRYRVIRGLNFPSGQFDGEGKVIEKRFEASTATEQVTVTDADLAGLDVPELVEAGVIEKVGVDTGFQDFGPGTVVALHGREAVVPAERAGDFEASKAPKGKE